jgi:hypothetical protein
MYILIMNVNNFLMLPTIRTQNFYRFTSLYRIATIIKREIIFWKRSNEKKET